MLLRSRRWNFVLEIDLSVALRQTLVELKISSRISMKFHPSIVALTTLARATEEQALKFHLIIGLSIAAEVSFSYDEEHIWNFHQNLSLCY